jgi:hypothetical protein
MKRKAIDWKSPKEADKEHCRRGKAKAPGSNQNAALAKSNPPHGVVVVNPEAPSKPQPDTASEHERAMQWYAWRDSGCAW